MKPYIILSLTSLLSLYIFISIIESTGNMFNWSKIALALMWSVIALSIILPLYIYAITTYFDRRDKEW